MATAVDRAVSEAATEVSMDHIFLVGGQAHLFAGAFGARIETLIQWTLVEELGVHRSLVRRREVGDSTVGRVHGHIG